MALTQVVSDLADAVAANTTATTNAVTALGTPAGLSAEDAASLANSLAVLNANTAQLAGATPGAGTAPVATAAVKTPALR